MTTYYVDDGGSATAPYDTWAKAATSLSALDDAVAFAADDTVYIGSDHVCQYTHSGHRTITGPTSGKPCKVISASTADTTYAKSSSNQIDTSESAYDLTLSGSFSWYGIQFKPGDDFSGNAGADYRNSFYDCTVIVPAGGDTIINVAGYFSNLIVDLTLDGTTNRSGAIFAMSNVAEFNGISFINSSYRTGVIFQGTTISTLVSGADFSWFTNATLCEILSVDSCTGTYLFNNCITASTWAPFSSGRPRATGKATFTNCGPANSPTYIAKRTYEGDVVSTTAIYRSSGATIETVNVSWLVTTESNCAQGKPHKSPYMYGSVSATGSKTFDVYITNDTADFTDAEVWLEIEHFSESTEAIWSVAHDAVATITTTGTAQTDDTSSTWNGTGPSFTYKQKLSVTATVDVAGLYRARVCTGVASIASSRYYYIDPLVTVS